MSEQTAGQGSGAKVGLVAALGYDEAAAYLGGVSRSYLEHSDVPRVKLGRRVLFRIVDLDRYLANHCDMDVAS